VHACCRLWKMESKGANAFFERLGLFSLVKAWRLALQSH
jgi:hypothetical protein